MIEQIVDSVIGGFDFSYCLTINILTYIVISVINAIKHKDITKWQKRIVLVIAIAIIGTLYYLVGTDLRVLINSSILAPVSWSWIFKPICSKFNIDYKNASYDKDK